MWDRIKEIKIYELMNLKELGFLCSYSCCNFAIFCAIFVLLTILIAESFITYWFGLSKTK